MRWFQVLSTAVLLNFSFAAQGSNDVPVFVTPPTPQALADILFKPRYRSVAGGTEKQANEFGMMINFEFDSTQILPASLPLLDSVGEMLSLKRIENEVLVIEGHTDSSGTESYNSGLSERRAEAIKIYLVDSFGIAAQRLVTLGRGEVDLYDFKQPENPLNRRAVFKPFNNISIN